MINKQRVLGFTLIEVLLVVVILGVIAGIAAPNFSGTYARLQLNESAKNIQYLMRYAQSRAILKNKAHRIDFDLNEHTCVIKEKSTGQGFAETEGSYQNIEGRWGRNYHIPPGIILEIAQPQIEFFPDGKMTRARIYLQSARGQTMTVSTQEQSGQVQIFDFKVEDGDEPSKN